MCMLVLCVCACGRNSGCVLHAPQAVSAGNTHLSLSLSLSLLCCVFRFYCALNLVLFCAASALASPGTSFGLADHPRGVTEIAVVDVFDGNLTISSNLTSRSKINWIQVRGAFRLFITRSLKSAAWAAGT
jgi:hypothetical protein